MTTAFLLINCYHNSEESVLEKIKTIISVKELCCVVGNYDILVKIESNTVDELKSIINWKIRKIDKIRSTTTLVCTEVKKNTLTVTT